MEALQDKASELLESVQSGIKDAILDSRATSPGLGAPPSGWQSNARSNGGSESKEIRSRPRTFPYSKYLPYEVESDEVRQNVLEEIITQLYISIQIGDFAISAMHWTRELRGWLGLKFDLRKDQRIRLARLYYELALAPGIDTVASERFASTFAMLLKKKHYLQRGVDLVLDWRPIFRELKTLVLSAETGTKRIRSTKGNHKLLLKVCATAQLYFDPAEIPIMLEEILPYFTTSATEGAYIVIGLLNLILPTLPPPTTSSANFSPQSYLPALFHLWSLINRSKVFDTTFLDLFSRLARDQLGSTTTSFNENGIFTQPQSSVIFTAILRLLGIPVGQATSPYTEELDGAAGLGVFLEKDPKRHPVSNHIARWIVMSLSPASSKDDSKSIMAHLEGLIQATETFFHPSNSGSWTRTLSQTVYYLCDFFVMRWNREQNGELIVPAERRIDAALKRRFVLCLRDVVFMGIFAKTGSAMDYALSSLQSLAFLEPDLILPGALQRIYPSLQGLSEVHRTTSSLRALQALSQVIIRQKGYRCHVTTLLGLVLPGIDANDLDKTVYTLSFIQSVCYGIPFKDLTKNQTDVTDNSLAMNWVTSEMLRMETEGASVKMDYQKMLSDHDEEMILRSSTAGFSEFIVAFLGKVFSLLENLPDVTRARSGSPEENVINTLPATFLPLLASLSPELYDIALNKIANFISDHVIHQARDAMAFICSALTKTNPVKALDRLIPALVGAIRTEIEDNGAASTRQAGSEVLPRDRALVWNVSILTMSVVHVGDAVVVHRDALIDIATLMQERCKGNSTLHVYNFSHHLLLNLTSIYTVDWRPYEIEESSREIGPQDWGTTPEPQNLGIRWHIPSKAESQFAADLVQIQGRKALKALRELMNAHSVAEKDGVTKDRSDALAQNLLLLRLLLSGVSVFLDPPHVQAEEPTKHANKDLQMGDLNNDTLAKEEDDEDTIAAIDEEEEKPTFLYPTGYDLAKEAGLYEVFHAFHKEVGHVLHDTHRYLSATQEDDVSCFGPLYNAYRSWFIDVGMERTAGVLDRNVRLLAADIHPYKISGLRKRYPRSLLVRRAYVYHLQRLRHNSYPRKKTVLASQLFLDLADSAVSQYTEVRRQAQNAGESAFKAIMGSRKLVIPHLLKAFERAVQENDYARIKGSIYSLLFSTLTKPIGRDWRYAPAVVKAYLAASTADRASIQRLCSMATVSIMDIGRSMERMAILDKNVIDLIAPTKEVGDIIDRRRDLLVRKRKIVEHKKLVLSEELVELAAHLHWKQASRTAAILLTLGMRFENIASEGLMRLMTRGSVDEHPSLRTLYGGAFTGLLSLIETRAVANHQYSEYLMAKLHLPARTKIEINAEDPAHTDRFLDMFAHPAADYFIDHDHPGWLVWTPTVMASKTNPDVELEFDQVEENARAFIGSMLDKSWFEQMFSNMNQEARDQEADQFNLHDAVRLVFTFDLLFTGASKATFEDIRVLVETTFGNGAEKHQHRSTAQILAALLISSHHKPQRLQAEVWQFVHPKIVAIFSTSLNPENIAYWQEFLRLVLQGKDPRRSWPLVDFLASFRLDLDSNAAFKESSKIRLLQQCVAELGWHFQLHQDVMDDFIKHIDHPYKGVREAMGHCLATIHSTRYHESFNNTEAFIDSAKNASSLGQQPYIPNQAFGEKIRGIFDQLEQWRQEHNPAEQTTSAYTSGAKTVLIWIESALSSIDCTAFIPFLPHPIMEQLLHMMDVKEDQELQSLAYSVFRHIPNIPYRTGEEVELVKKLIHIGRTSPLWHQRLRVMINMQVIYFRHLFLMDSNTQQELLACVTDMLQDSQLEVRLGASSTLAGMVRCSPSALRERLVEDLERSFTQSLVDHPRPKRIAARSTPQSSSSTDGTRLAMTRHAAVLGLGALVQAFPYASPPPSWIPRILATLASRANDDPGMVGQSVKTILSDFKKTRQDTWQIDVKAFTAEQAEYLEGVLWKSYFA